MDSSNNIITTQSSANLLVKTYNQMDDTNKKALKVWITKGPEAAVKHMFTGSTGERLTYLEMRERYG